MQAELIFPPDTFPFCHASTIEQAADGTLVAAWFAGSREGADDVGIWMSRLEDGSWTKPEEVATGLLGAGLAMPCWNPVLFQFRDSSFDPLVLFYKVGPKPWSWWGEFIQSHDSGKTWTQRFKLPDGMIGPVKNRPVMMDDGRLLCGSSTELDPRHGWRVHVESCFCLSDWRRSSPLNDGEKVLAIQPTILRMPQSWWMLCRNKRGPILESFSGDAGAVNWDDLEPTEELLPNANSGIAATNVDGGKYLLVYNHLTWQERRFERKPLSPLNVAVTSNDKWHDGWQPLLTLEDEPADFSYPTIMQAGDGKVHVVYSWKFRSIKHVTLTPGEDF